jgi:hypothetical protein
MAEAVEMLDAKHDPGSVVCEDGVRAESTDFTVKEYDWSGKRSEARSYAAITVVGQRHDNRIHTARL